MRRLLVILVPLLFLLLFLSRSAFLREPTPPPEPPRQTVSTRAELPATDDAGEASVRVDDPGEVDEFPVEGVVPDRLLGKGDASLSLHFVNRDTGTTVAARVSLWRCVVPAGGGWTAGDQIQRFLDVPTEGMMIRNLPPGWYRIQCDGQRRGAEDPVRFYVTSGANYRLVELEMPREARGLIRVFDEKGHEIREGMLRLGRVCGNAILLARAPAWSRAEAAGGPETRIRERPPL